MVANNYTEAIKCNLYSSVVDNDIGECNRINGIGWLLYKINELSNTEKYSNFNKELFNNMLNDLGINWFNDYDMEN